MKELTKIAEDPDAARQPGEQQDVELNEAQTQEVSGGAFDPYIYFRPKPHP